MAQIVVWNDITFAIGGTSILGIEDIGITGSCETEDSTVDGEKFVKRKNGKPYEIDVTALLDARLGVDVQSMAIKMTEAARCSTSGYFYTGSTKLFPCSFMMISADIVDIVLNPQGKWISCKAKLKLMQCTKYDGSTSSSASSSGSSSSKSSKKSSSKKSSTKKTNTTTSHLPMTGVSSKIIAAVAQKSSAAAKSSAIKSAAATVSKSKSVSSSIKKPSGASSKTKAMLK